MNALDDAADVEVKRRKLYGTANDQGKRTSRRVPGPLPPNRGRRVSDAPIQPALQPSQPPKIPETPSPFITKTSAGSRATKKERKRQQQSDFRTWHDSSGSHWHEAALVDCKDGIVHLSSSDGRLLEIHESKLSSGDLNYLRSSDVYRKAHHKGTRDSAGPGRSGIVRWLRKLIPGK